MTSKRKIRRVKLDWGWVEAKPGWSNTVLKFGEYRNNVLHEVVIPIKNPWEVRYIRGQLAKIEQAWKDEIEKAGT